jgi:hypothetical protein
MIELIPSASLLSTPLKFGRNQYFYITSSIQLNCVTSQLIKVQWTILTCMSTCLNQTEFNHPVETSNNNLFIRAQTLDYGVYQVELRVTMIDFPQLTSSSSIYIEIIRSTIFTNLVSSNSLIITHDYQQNLIFNPGEFSFDLNSITFNKSVSQQSQYIN